MTVLAPLSIFFEHEGLAKGCYTQTPATISYLFNK